MIDQRYRKVSFSTAISDFFKGSVDYSGFTSRAGHWFPVGLIYLIFAGVYTGIFASVYKKYNSIGFFKNVIGFSDAAELYLRNNSEFASLLYIITGVFILLHIPIAASFCRRLRDVGFTTLFSAILIALYVILAYFYVALITPVYVIVFFFILMSLPANKVETNNNDEFSKFVFRQSFQAQQYYAQFNNQQFDQFGNPISKRTADIMKEELYGVVNGTWAQGGKRYAVENYSTSGKTGTAEVVDPKTGTYYKSPYKVMHSFIGYAPSEDPQVILYVGLKLPSKELGASNANGASEIFKPIMENTLNYLNVKKSKDNNTIQSYQMDNLVGENVESTIVNLQQKTKNIITIGSGTKVVGQYPSAGNIIKQGERVFLLVSDENIITPNFTGWSKVDVLNYAKLSGLDIEIEGNGFAKQQSIPAQRFVKKGEKIKIKFS